jgi:uncharacterized OB-fold protein
MTARALMVFACGVCGAVEFPRRLLCPQCGSVQQHEVAAGAGTVEETTVVRHRAGAHGEAPVHLATIRTQAGPRVIARLGSALLRGAQVSLQQQADDAIVAEALPPG